MSTDDGDVMVNPTAAGPVPPTPEASEAKEQAAGPGAVAARMVDVQLASEEGDQAVHNRTANHARPPWNVNYVSTDPLNALDPRFPLGFNERDIRMAICVTGYNEDYGLMNGTLQAIAENLDRCQAFTNGNLRPEQVLVFVVFDGRAKVNRSIFTDGATGENIYFTEQDMANMIAREEQERQHAEARIHQRAQAERAAAGAGMQVAEISLRLEDAHMFETQMVLNKTAKTAYNSAMNLMFCFKVKNGGKINSHRWFFTNLCKRINPDYCVILDMGTNPGEDAILRLFQDMEQNKDIGGCCGQIAISSQFPTSYMDFIVASQIYEYKASNFLDKSMESLFGYISVLPGAFSAYRWQAIRPLEGEERCPLDEYFKLADMSEARAAKVNPWTANMYLAEDRILGFEMLVRKNAAWTLHYNSEAPAYTDCPESLAQIISQRRRWLNGSFFAQLHVVSQSASRLWGADHSIPRKLALGLLMFYNFLQIILTVFLLGNSYLIFTLSLHLAIPEDSTRWNLVEFTFTTLYLLVTAAQFIFALGNSPRQPENRAVLNKVYLTFSAIYGVMMVFATVAILAKVGEFSRPVFWTGVFTTCGIYLAALMHGELLTMLATTIQFYCMVLTYLNTFVIYSFCRCSDISWGTRETNPEAAAFAAKRGEVFALFRSLFVLAWIFVNIVGVALILEFEVTDTYAKVVVVIVCVFLGARFIGSAVYKLTEMYKIRDPTRCRTPTARPPAVYSGAGAPSSI